MCNRCRSAGIPRITCGFNNQPVNGGFDDDELLRLFDGGIDRRLPGATSRDA